MRHFEALVAFRRLRLDIAAYQDRWQLPWPSLHCVAIGLLEKGS